MDVKDSFSQDTKKDHETLRERCNQLGCTINEYIEHSIEFALNGSTDFEFESDEPEIKPESEITVTNIE